jgi:nucleotide-binding universal stress UspA family protein
MPREEDGKREGRKAMSTEPITRILLATLGSPWSKRALEFAVRLAQAYELELVIVAVLTPTYKPAKKAVWGVELTSTVEDEVRQLAHKALDGASTLARAAGVKHICELREGRAPEEILKTAKEHQCDLIIVGSRGLSGVSRVTLGETGSEVMLKAPVPVVVVK